MITLITGLPGNGKTLYALSYVKAWAEKDNRPVFYSGINDLKLPWEEIDPEKWFEVPKNSIVVIDECQRVFRPRTISKDIPDYVSKLETHRHLGIDIVLITQHPMLADSSIRRLCGKHLHVVRTFGTERATVHEWASVKDNCDKSAGRSDSIKHLWKYDKSAFDYYKSAEVHTVKRAIPMRIYLFLLVPVLIVAAVFYMYNFTKNRTNPVSTPSTLSKTGDFKNASLPTKFKYQDELNESKQYVYDRTARVEGLPQTAPIYDEITKPTRVPVPSGCLASSTKCGCWSQQATPIEMPEALCRDIVKNGYFQDFNPNGKEEKRDILPPVVVAKNEQKEENHSRVIVMDVPKSSIPTAVPVEQNSSTKSNFSAKI